MKKTISTIFSGGMLLLYTSIWFSCHAGSYIKDIVEYLPTSEYGNVPGVNVLFHYMATLTTEKVMTLYTFYCSIGIASIVSTILCASILIPEMKRENINSTWRYMTTRVNDGPTVIYMTHAIGLVCLVLSAVLAYNTVNAIGVIHEAVVSVFDGVQGGKMGVHPTFLVTLFLIPAGAALFCYATLMVNPSILISWDTSGLSDKTHTP